MKVNKVNDKSAERLISIIQSVTGLDPCKKSRKDGIIEARMIFYKIMREKEEWTLAKIASQFHLDHGTAYHGIKELNKMLYVNKRLASIYRKCLGLYIDGGDGDKSGFEITLINELKERDSEISRLNDYIRAVEKKLIDIELRDKGYEDILSVIRDRIPPGKVNIAAKKINVLLNNL